MSPVFASVHNIPERLYEYDNTFFLVRNHQAKRFEVHSLDNIGDTYCFAVPYKELDARTIRHLWRNDLRVHGDGIFKDIERQEAKREADKKKEWKNWVESVGKETRSMLAEDAWNL